MSDEAAKFTMLFGASPEKLAERLAISKEEAQAAVERFNKQYPNIVKLRERFCKRTK